MLGQLLNACLLTDAQRCIRTNHELFMTLREQIPAAIDPDEVDRLAYEQVLAQARSTAGAAALRRLEEGFHDYYRGNGEDPLYLPGLQRHAWWDPHEVLDARRLEASYPRIRAEVESLLSHRIGFQHFDEGGSGFTAHDTNKSWNVFYLRWDCRDIIENIALCPETGRELSTIPNRSAMAFYSALCGGAHIPAHVGSMGVVITVHLGLIVPDGCTLRVADQTQHWKEGRCLAFQDAFEHEARNESGRTRVNLMFDVWHPDLTPFERDFLERWTVQCGVLEAQAGIISSPERHRGQLDSIDWWK